MSPIGMIGIQNLNKKIRIFGIFVNVTTLFQSSCEVYVKHSIISFMSHLRVMFCHCHLINTTRETLYMLKQNAHKIRSTI